MRFLSVIPLSVLVLMAAHATVDAGDDDGHGFLQRMTDGYHRMRDGCRLKWTRCHRAVKNDTYYCECPPFWMDNYGYYQTRWRKLPPEAVRPIPDEQPFPTPPLPLGHRPHGSPHAPTLQGEQPVSTADEESTNTEG